MIRQARAFVAELLFELSFLVPTGVRRRTTSPEDTARAFRELRSSWRWRLHTALARAACAVQGDTPEQQGPIPPLHHLLSKDEARPLLAYFLKAAVAHKLLTEAERALIGGVDPSLWGPACCACGHRRLSHWGLCSVAGCGCAGYVAVPAPEPAAEPSRAARARVYEGIGTQDVRESGSILTLEFSDVVPDRLVFAATGPLVVPRKAWDADGAEVEIVRKVDGGWGFAAHPKPVRKVVCVAYGTGTVNGGAFGVIREGKEA